jgi:hypothetical protein
LKDWAAAFPHLGGKLYPDGPQLSTTDAVFVEYLRSVLAPGECYSFEVGAGEVWRPAAAVPAEDEVLAADAPASRDGVTHFFQVKNMVSPASRPVLAPTAEGNPEFEGAFNVLVQYLDRFDDGTAPVGDSIELFEDSDDLWVRWQDLGPWNSLRRHMTHWRVCEASAHPACVVWSGPQNAHNQLALTDPKCPAIILAESLHQLGWQG